MSSHEILRKFQTLLEKHFRCHDYSSESQIHNLLCADSNNYPHAHLRVKPILNQLNTWSALIFPSPVSQPRVAVRLTS